MLSGVVRLIANHRPSTSSKARLKQGSFPPPPLHGFSGTMTLSDSHRVRIAAAMEHKLHPSGSPTLPASPLRRAMPTTPADRMEAVDTFFHPCCLPRSLGGSASATALSRPAQASLALWPTASLNRPRRPLSRGFDAPVLQPRRSSASGLSTSLRVESSSTGDTCLRGTPRMRAVQ